MMNYRGSMMTGPAPSAAERAFGEAPIRVMIVDDSAVVRGLVSRWIEEEPGMEVVARHPNGKLAVADVARSAPDLVLLDIEMPVMDGLEALPLLLKARPGVRVLIVSTLTRRNAEISFRALALGALDYLPKPDSNSSLTLSLDFRGEVIRKIRALGPVRSVRAALDEAERAVANEVRPSEAHAQHAFKLRPFSLVPPRVIAIGSSTGGPQALASVLGALAPSSSRVPVLIAQHMPPMFTEVLAERLSKAVGREAKEGRDGEPVRPGIIYVAPGGHHMTVLNPTAPALRIGEEPPVHFCRPAVDPLFSSAAAVWGGWVLGIILTGMGSDGTRGAADIVAAGGGIIAQDEATSVVWGMPGSAVQAKLCSAVLPLDDIATKVSSLFSGARA